MRADAEQETASTQSFVHSSTSAGFGTDLVVSASLDGSTALLLLQDQPEHRQQTNRQSQSQTQTNTSKDGTRAGQPGQRSQRSIQVAASKQQQQHRKIRAGKYLLQRLFELLRPARNALGLLLQTRALRLVAGLHLRSDQTKRERHNQATIPRVATTRLEWNVERCNQNRSRHSRQQAEDEFKEQRQFTQTDGNALKSGRQAR